MKDVKDAAGVAYHQGSPNENVRKCIVDRHGEPVQEEQDSFSKAQVDHHGTSQRVVHDPAVYDSTESTYGLVEKTRRGRLTRRFTTLRVVNS